MPRGHPLSPQEREGMRSDVVARYQGGETVRSLAAHHEVSYGVMHRLLAEAGVLRGRGVRKGSRFGPRQARTVEGIEAQPSRPAGPLDVDDELRAHLAPRSDDDRPAE